MATVEKPRRRDPYADIPQHLPPACDFEVKCCGSRMVCVNTAQSWPRAADRDAGSDQWRRQTAQTTENQFECERCGAELTLKLVEKNATQAVTCPQIPASDPAPVRFAGLPR